MFAVSPVGRTVPAKWAQRLTGLSASANDPSPAIWWCTRARSRASAAARWSTGRRTAATSSGGDHHVINRRMNMGDAMMNRPLMACRETVLRHRQRNSTCKQRSQKRDNLQGGHLHTLLTPALTQTRRRKHIVRLDVFDLDHRLVRIVVSWTKPCPTPRALGDVGRNP